MMECFVIIVDTSEVSDTHHTEVSIQKLEKKALSKRCNTDWIAKHYQILPTHANTSFDAKQSIANRSEKFKDYVCPDHFWTMV